MTPAAAMNMVAPVNVRTDELEPGCRSHGCSGPSLYRVYWPGQTTSMCGYHTRQAQGIAEAMGFELVAEVWETWAERERVKRLVADAERRLGG